MSDTVFDLSKGYPYRATQKKTRLNMMCVEEKKEKEWRTPNTHQPKHSRTIQVTIKFLIILWRHRVWRTHLPDCAFGVLSGARICVPRADGAQHKCFPHHIYYWWARRQAACHYHYEMGNGRKTPAIYTTAETQKTKICFWFLFFSCPRHRHSVSLTCGKKHISHLDIACKTVNVIILIWVDRCADKIS